MLRIIVLITLLTGLTAVLGQAVAAVPFFRPGMITQATLDEVDSAVGNRSISVQCGATGTMELEAAEAAARSRNVRVTLGKSGTAYQDTRVINTMLREAAEAVLNQCPVIEIYAVSQSMPAKDIGYAEIYGSLSDGGPQTLLVHADNYLGNIATWDRVTDVGVQQIQREAEARAQQERAAQLLAEDVARAESLRQAQDARDAEARRQYAENLAAQQAQIVAERVAAKASARRARMMVRFLKKTGRLMPYAIAVLLFGLLFAVRAPLARWYYFTFHPHPAAPLVRAAVRGADLDGRALSNALSEEPTGSKIFRDVRMAQTEALFKVLNTASLKKLAQQEKQKAQHSSELAAAVSIREAVKNAAVALERAKALQRASQEIRAKGGFQ